MAKIWEESKGYNIARFYVDLCTITGFRSVKIFGKEKIPTDGCVLLAPNHSAALMDPLLVLLINNKPIGFGARADIFRKPLIAKFLRWIRIVPLARERDGRASVTQNLSTFEEIIDCLDHNVPFCMFAEGTHYSQRGMLPFKKGIFRIAKLAHDQLGKKVYVVPIGLEYEDYFRQLKRAEIRIGDPVEIGEYFNTHADLTESEIYKRLCEEVREKDLQLLNQIPQRKKFNFTLRALFGLICLPLFFSCACSSITVWLPAILIMGSFKDKAWTHTVYWAARALQPWFWIPYWIFEALADFYINLIKDFRGGQNRID